MDGCAIVVLLGVSERISNIMRGKVGHMVRVLVDVNRCSCRCVIDMVVVLIVVNMSLLLHGLVIDLVCYYGLVVNFMCHDWLMVDFVSHDGLVNDLMSYDVCVLW